MATGLIAICISAFLFGLTDVLLKTVQLKIPVLPLLIIRSSISALGLLLLFLLSRYFPALVNTVICKPIIIQWNMLSYAALLCSVSYFGLFFFMQAIKYSLVSETVGFNKIGVVIGIIIGIVVYKESFTLQKMICTFVILCGVAVLEKHFFLRNTKGISKGLLFIFFARTCWSVGYLFVPCIKALGVLFFSFFVESVVCTWSIILYLLDKNKTSVKKWNVKPVFKTILFIALIGIVAEVGSNVARSGIPIILLAFLSLIQPITTLFFSRFYAGERLNGSQWLGIGLGMLGALIFTWK